MPKDVERMSHAIARNMLGALDRLVEPAAQRAKRLEVDPQSHDDELFVHAIRDKLLSNLQALGNKERDAARDLGTSLAFEVQHVLATLQRGLLPLDTTEKAPAVIPKQCWMASDTRTIDFLFPGADTFDEPNYSVPTTTNNDDKEESDYERFLRPFYLYAAARPESPSSLRKGEERRHNNDDKKQKNSLLPPVL